MFLNVTVLFLTLTLIPLAVRAADRNQEEVIRVEEYGVFHQPSSANALSYEKLKELIQSESISNIDELLDYFSRSSESKSYLQNFTFLYNSQSAQSENVSPEHPRIVFYKDRLIFGITAEGSDLEIFELPPKSVDFAVHRINFSEAESAKRFVDSPKNCKGCHGSPPTPIWGNYKLWPGAFGSNEDLVLEPKVGFQTHESTFFQNFLKKRNTGRYSFFTFSDPLFKDEGEATKFGTVKKLRSNPNVRFSIYMSGLNNIRIARRLKQLPTFQKYKFALLAAILRCKDVPDFLPKEVRRAHEAQLNADYSKLGEETRKVTKSEFAGRVDAFTRLLGANFDLNQVFDLRQELDLYSSAVMSGLRYLIEGQGTKIDDWSLSYAPGDYSYSFGAGPYGPEGIARSILLPELIRSNPELKLSDLAVEKYIFFSQIPSADLERSCETLKTKSLATFINPN